MRGMKDAEALVGPNISFPGTFGAASCLSGVTLQCTVNVDSHWHPSTSVDTVIHKCASKCFLPKLYNMLVSKLAPKSQKRIRATDKTVERQATKLGHKLKGFIFYRKLVKINQYSRLLCL